MQLVTRCPACSTLFKIVPDQLKISQGWVRCGQCSEIFEAATHYVQAQQDATPNPVIDKIANKKIANNDHLTLTLSDFSVDLATPSQTGLPKSTSAALALAKPVLAAQTKQATTQITIKPTAQTTAPVAAAPVAVARSAPALALASPPLAIESMPAKLNNSSFGTESLSPPAETPEFVRDAQRAARWRSPWVRAALALVALALLALLGAQLALHERARLAAVEPRATPWLGKLCQIELYTQGQACTVGALQQIESIVVDASTFNKLRSDASSETYRLAASLKNTSALPLAMPAVEVSFTDSQEQVLLRRVLSAADFGASAQQALSIPAAGEFAGVSTLVVDLPALAAGKITGYRLLAFYP